jgi:uncharacterized protein (DUF433 family)
MKTDADEKELPEGLPYQTRIASLLHKYSTVRLKEIYECLHCNS